MVFQDQSLFQQIGSQGRCWLAFTILGTAVALLMLVAHFLPQYKNEMNLRKMRRQSRRNVEARQFRHNQIQDQILKQNADTINGYLHVYFRLVAERPDEQWEFSDIIDFLEKNQLIRAGQVNLLTKLMTTAKYDTVVPPTDCDFESQLEAQRASDLRRLESERLASLQHERAREKRIEEESMRAARSEREAAKNRQRFLKSPDFNFVKQFVTRFGNSFAEAELSKLQLLLAKRKHDCSIEQLRVYVLAENRARLDDLVEQRIFSNHPKSIHEVVRTFMEYFNPEDEDNLECLAEKLREKGIVDIDSALLLTRVDIVRKEIELEHFEKRLTDESQCALINEIDELSGYEFENYLGNLFTNMGFEVEQTSFSRDQGADLLIIKHGERTVVQAKRCSSKVGNKAVQEVLASIRVYNAHRGMVVANQHFTPSAIELAKANNVEMVDRDLLNEWISNFG